MHKSCSALTSDNLEKSRCAGWLENSINNCNYAKLSNCGYQTSNLFRYQGQSLQRLRARSITKIKGKVDFLT